MSGFVSISGNTFLLAGGGLCSSVVIGCFSKQYPYMLSYPVHLPLWQVKPVNSLGGSGYICKAASFILCVRVHWSGAGLCVNLWLLSIGDCEGLRNQ
ncbi:MAG: hypothetical protein APR63_02335 [Desulfuromonas sp. SDB]|nr:MAG: hypothetical protein APR63_02335 [Desulfuromonas sp. SDB]